jgi:hypothetical protein
MVRRTTLACAAAVVLALSATTTAASARHIGHPGWHGPGARTDPALIGVAAAPLIWGPPAYACAGGCYIRPERTLTPGGWRWRRVEVCY